MGRAVGIVILALAAAAPVRSQDEAGLWMPEGYRLLSFEERKALAEDELKALQTENTRRLREAVREMSPEERQAVSQRLSQFGASHELRDYEKQYITLTQMFLLSAGEAEKREVESAAAEARFQQLLHDQETDTKGFPAEQAAVENEAAAIESEVGKADSRVLYLRALRPLRVRPWNSEIRWCFRQVVRSEPYSASQKRSLYLAALAFLQAREKESPAEGSWFSLDAYLRLTVAREVPEARRLFAIAVQKNANDVESRTYPILFAEIDGDQKEVERLMPRAREAWPDEQDLQLSLIHAIDALPPDLQARAKEAVGNKYKKAFPADWASRAEILEASLARGSYAEVESESTAVLALPATSLPVRDRSAFLALRLRAAAGLGRCEEVVGQIPQLEAAVALATPDSTDEFAPPPPRRARDVAALRAQLREGQRDLQDLRGAIADGSIEASPGWDDVPKAERRDVAEQWASDLEAHLEKMKEILKGSDEAVAAEWSRRELADWYASHNIPATSLLDAADPGSRLVIQVRGAAGKCLLAHHRAADAARVLVPCVGSGANYHEDCAVPILEAGRELVQQGQLQEAASVYRATAALQNYTLIADDLYWEIERAAPGTVKRYVPPAPAATPGATQRP
jgi:hypothetical protein